MGVATRPPADNSGEEPISDGHIGITLFPKLQQVQAPTMVAIVGEAMTGHWAGGVGQTVAGG